MSSVPPARSIRVGADDSMSTGNYNRLDVYT